MIRAILAHDSQWGIGKNGGLPWPKHSADLRWFKECTVGGIVVMGRNTWESLPRKPLPDRINVIVTTQTIENALGNMVVNIDTLFEILPKMNYNKNIWIIGGAQLVESCLAIIDELWLNNVGGDYNCDVFLPKQKITTTFSPKHVDFKSFGTITRWIKKLQ